MVMPEWTVVAIFLEVSIQPHSSNYDLIIRKYYKLHHHPENQSSKIRIDNTNRMLRKACFWQYGNVVVMAGLQGKRMG